MPEVTIFPRRFDEEQADEVRGVRAAECFQHMLTAAKAQLAGGDVNWYALGLGEAEAVMEAWSTGGRHGFFQIWQRRKATIGGNRPAPSPTELRARRMVVLLCVALERGGCRKRAARKLAARELEMAGVFTHAPTHRSIEHWQGEQSALAPADEQLLATAIASCGFGDPHRLATFFIGLAHLFHNPAPRVEFTP
jgi:hypothetical protein